MPGADPALNLTGAQTGNEQEMAGTVLGTSGGQSFELYMLTFNSCIKCVGNPGIIHNHSCPIATQFPGHVDDLTTRDGDR